MNKLLLVLSFVFSNILFSQDSIVTSEDSILFSRDTLKLSDLVIYNFNGLEKLKPKKSRKSIDFGNYGNSEIVSSLSYTEKDKIIIKGVEFYFDKREDACNTDFHFTPIILDTDFNKISELYKIYIDTEYQDHIKIPIINDSIILEKDSKIFIGYSLSFNDDYCDRLGVNSKIISYSNKSKFSNYKVYIKGPNDLNFVEFLPDDNFSLNYTIFYKKL